MDASKQINQFGTHAPHVSPGVFRASEETLRHILRQAECETSIHGKCAVHISPSHWRQVSPRITSRPGPMAQHIPGCDARGAWRRPRVGYPV